MQLVHVVVVDDKSSCLGVMKILWLGRDRATVAVAFAVVSIALVWNDLDAITLQTEWYANYGNLHEYLDTIQANSLNHLLHKPIITDLGKC